MTWFLKLLAPVLTLPSHQKKYLLMGLLVQSIPHLQRNLPRKPKLLLLRLLRFLPRSIIFKVCKPQEIKRKVKIEIKNLETNRRLHDQPIMTTAKGKGRINILVCYAVVTIFQRSVPVKTKSPSFWILIPHPQYLWIPFPLNNNW